MLKINRNILIRLFLLVGFFHLSNNYSLANLSKSQSNPKYFIGKVQTDNSLNAENLEIFVWNADETENYVLNDLTVKDSGSKIFSLEWPGENPLVLEVRGEKGAGRVFVDPEKLTDTLFISYPVTEKIVFLHTNDHHFDINLPDQLAEKIAEIRQSYNDVFLFEAGDIFVRHRHRWIDNGVLMEDPVWYAQRAKQMVALMNQLEYTVMTPGNHEFDYVETFTLEALSEADFPIIAANIDVVTDLFPAVKPFVQFSTSTGRSIHVLGLAAISSEGKGIVQNDIFDTAREYMFLRENADVFMALTHIGLQNDARLAAEFQELDFIIGGHSHHYIEEAVFVGDVMIAQAGGNRHEVSENHPVYLGKVTVILENGILTEKSGYIIVIGEENN
ncbi:MAG: metallophosphoesterase [Bacteroidales bacterium]|nr:metallophosphoesterase [Bacteroidales bacterium]